MAGDQRTLLAGQAATQSCYRGPVPKVVLFTCLTLASVLIGIFAPVAVQNNLKAGIRDAIVWRPDSPAATETRFRGLSNPGDPMDVSPQLTVWMWNITNLDEIRQGAKPKLQKVGPYVYNKIRRKLDVWWDNKGHVSVQEYTFHLPANSTTVGEAIQPSSPSIVPASSSSKAMGPASSSAMRQSATAAAGLSRRALQALSNRRTEAGTVESILHGLGSQDSSTAAAPKITRDADVTVSDNDNYAGPVSDMPAQSDPLDLEVVTLNLPLLAVVESIRGSMGSEVARLIEVVVATMAGLQDERVDGMFVRRTVRELLWGYEDPTLVALARLLPAGMVPLTRVSLLRNMTSVEEALAQGTTIYDTGVNNISNLWNIERDAGVERVTAWPGGEGCEVGGDRVRGSDATQFPPGIKCYDALTEEPNRLRLWVKDLYRGMDIVCQDEEWVQGVRLLRFAPDPAEAGIDPCHDQSVQGLMNITRPRAAGPSGNASTAYGAPLFVSSPNFCGADPELREWVEGLEACLPGNGSQAIPSKFSTFVDIEPNTGIPMRAAKRIQLSSQLTEEARANLEPMIASSPVLPIMMAFEEFEVGQAQAQAFKDSVYWAMSMRVHLRIWFLLAGLVFAGLAVAFLVWAVSGDGDWQQRELARGEAARKATEEAARQAWQRKAATPDLSSHNEPLLNGVQEQEQAPKGSDEGALPALPTSTSAAPEAAAGKSSTA